MTLVKPEKLKVGDIIGVVAPACPFPSDDDSEYLHQYMNGKKALEKMGFKVVEGQNIHKQQWWRAGTPKERALDINEMFGNPSIRAIIAHDGGNDSISLLEYLDYELISKNPKPFIGFSNITNIHSVLYSKVGLVGFHMGLLTYELGNYWLMANQETREIGEKYFYEILTSDKPIGKLTNMTEWECWRVGSVEGRLFGGNLSMLDSLIGTPYFPTKDILDKSILFWELDNSPSYRIERILTHLKYAGVFDLISGMIVGKLVDIIPSTKKFEEPTNKELILEVLKDFHFPILGNVDFGHKMVQLPMPIGISAKMDCQNLSLELLEAAVK